MNRLSSNRELYEYLVNLAVELRDRGQVGLSEKVVSASKHASSNISTEFLGESRIALHHVLDRGDGILTEQELADLGRVIQQLNDAFDKR